MVEVQFCLELLLGHVRQLGVRVPLDEEPVLVEPVEEVLPEVLVELAQVV
jgi:hypothetical protein